MFEIFVIWIFFQNRKWREKKTFKKCTPLHTLEGKHSELWHNVFRQVFWYSYNTTLTWSMRYFYVTIQSHAWVHIGDALLLEMDMLVIMIILTSFSCIPAGSRKVVVLGRHELVPSSSSRRVCPVWHDEVWWAVFLSVNGNILAMLIIRRILGPPESA